MTQKKHNDIKSKTPNIKVKEDIIRDKEIQSEEKLNVLVDRYHLKEDGDKIVAICKHYGPFYPDQEDFIFYFLKRYIDAGRMKPCASCPGSPIGYATTFNECKEYYFNNKSKFE